MTDVLQLLKTIQLHDGEGTIDNYGEEVLSLEGVTHLVSTTSDFPTYDSACDAMIPTVKPSWLEHSLAKNKLQNPRQYSPDQRMFMSDIVACCADLPEGDADAIAGGILAMGGLFTSRLTSQVTHIVALSMDSEQCETSVRRNLPIKIVLPHWFDDCLRLGRKIDEQPYILPDPEILKAAHDRAPIANATRTHVTGAVDPDPSSTPPPTPSATRKEQRVFKNKKIMLGKDLGIGSHLRGVLEGIIKSSQGRVVSSTTQCDIFVCRYRAGADYVSASRANKQVGNLAWLYYLMTNDSWTSPLRRLLHYPVSKETLPGFATFKISLSNYTGEARTYLENLITATGAECTKTLKQDNTHLITAHIQSEKCAAAKDWGVELVNHLWIEESYARWKLQSLTNPKYTHFPSRTNLGEVVGQTQIDRSVLEAAFWQDEDEDMPDAPNEDGPMQPVSNNTVAKAEPKQRRAKQIPQKDVLKTLATSRFAGVGKENITPTTGSSRKSKDAATAKLHEMTPDILLYEKEKKRSGGVIYGGRKKTDEERVEPVRKRSFEDMADPINTADAEPKKQKKGLPSPIMHILVSGYNRWVGQPKLEDIDRSQLRHLGIIITLDPSRATHLAAPHILRTRKFVMAMAYAPTIISTNYIDSCLEQDRLLDADKFLLQDKTNEKKLGFSLPLSRERAKENRNELLRDRAVYCLENIHGGFESFRPIVEANGGKCMIWRNRKGTMVPSRRAESDPETDDETANDVYLLSGPGKENEKLWQRFREMAAGSRKVPRIVVHDWLIETAMSQKLLSTGAYEIDGSQ